MLTALGVELVSLGQSQGVGRGAFRSEALGENSFSDSGGSLHFLTCGPFKASSKPAITSLQSLLSVPHLFIQLPSLLLSLIGTLDYIGPIQIILDFLHISRSSKSLSVSLEDIFTGSKD